MLLYQAISLNDVVDADAIEKMGILDDPEVQEMLLPLLPEGRQTEEELRQTVSASTSLRLHLFVPTNGMQMLSPVCLSSRVNRGRRKAKRGEVV